MLGVAAFVSYLLAALVFFGVIDAWTTSTGLGLVALGLALQALSGIPYIYARVPDVRPTAPPAANP